MLNSRNCYIIRNVISIILLLSTIIYVVYGGTNDEGLKYLEENGKDPDVVTLASGLQYKILKKGDGQYHPAIDSPCECHYEGKLIDGTKFDSSYDRGEPTTFAPNQVIPGWTEAMQLMVEGDTWMLYIPSELGYGDRGSGSKIPGGSVLVFKMEIISINDSEEKLVPAKLCNVTTKEKCIEKEIKYLDKISTWDVSKMKKEWVRLNKLTDDTNKIKLDLKRWIKKRMYLLQDTIYTIEPPKDSIDDVISSMKEKDGEKEEEKEL